MSSPEALCLIFRLNLESASWYTYKSVLHMHSPWMLNSSIQIDNKILLKTPLPTLLSNCLLMGSDMLLCLTSFLLIPCSFLLIYATFLCTQLTSALTVTVVGCIKVMTNLQACKDRLIEVGVEIIFSLSFSLLEHSGDIFGNVYWR